MLDQLAAYEREVFFYLNGSTSSFYDHFIWLFSGKAIWLPFAALMLFFLFYKKDWRSCLFLAIAITLVITLADQFSSGFCKSYFMRLRPTHNPIFQDQVKTVFNYRGGLYGFISSHAANAFGFVVFMSLIIRKKIFVFIFLLWAIFTAYTRIYLGVHFLSDVSFGALAGSLIGYLVYLGYKRIPFQYQMHYSYPVPEFLAGGLVLWIVLFLGLTEPLIHLFQLS